MLALYGHLPAFKDAKTGLASFDPENFRLFAFSNGSAKTVDRLLIEANIRASFLSVVSVEDIKTFKPAPAVYDHFLKCSGAQNSAWLVSSNPFDVIGALSHGMRAAWIQRSFDNIIDPWGIDPTLTVDSLIGLGERIAAYEQDP